MLLDPLMEAISTGDPNEVDRLISLGADIVSMRETRHPRYFATTTMSPLGWAAYLSSKHGEEISRRIIYALLMAGADASVGKAILFATSASAIELLAGAGAPLNAIMADGWPQENGLTALMLRAEALDANSVDLLVILGADGSLVTASGASALDYAIRGNDTVKATADVALRIQLIFSISRSNPPFNLFSQAMLSVANIDLLEKISAIEPGPPPTERTVYNRFAVSVRPLMEVLESFGGIPTGVVENAPARRNILMLMLANRAFRYEPYDELSWLCRKYGFSLLDDADARGESVLFHIFNPDTLYPRFLPELVTLLRLFIAYNANLNYRNNKGETVLHRIVRSACRARGSVSPDPFPCDRVSGDLCQTFRQAADLLISAGADPKLMDYSGKTPGREARDRPNCPFSYLPAGIDTYLISTNDLEPELQSENKVLSWNEGKNDNLDSWILTEEISQQSVDGEPNTVDEREPGENIAIDVLWMRQSSGLVEPTCLPTEPGHDEVADTLASEDPEAARLAPAVASLYRNANQKYLAMPEHKDAYIRINTGNGKRSTVRQAQLYEQYIFYAYYGGPGPVSKANRPGKSKHEYGFAIDVIRASDESRLSKALETSGWEQTVEDEGWHWEAVGAPRYAALKAFIDNDMNSISENWALTLSSFYERRKESLAMLQELEALRVDLIEAQRTAEEFRQQLTQESTWLEREDNRLRTVYDEISSIDQQIVFLQREKANKRYTYCPNGQAYFDCDHTALKQKYDNELRQLDQTILSKRTRRSQLARDYDSGRREMSVRRQKYAAKEAQWRAQLRQVNILQGQISAKRQQVSVKQNEMQTARKTATTQLADIAAKVARWS